MKRVVILGAGTGGTMVANKLVHELDEKEWEIVIVDRDETHYYQPGFLFIPFGIYSPRDVEKPRRDFIPRGVKLILSDIEMIEPEKNRVVLSKDKQTLSYDYLVIATGTHIQPAETEGLLDGGGWRENIFDRLPNQGRPASWAACWKPKASTWKQNSISAKLITKNRPSDPGINAKFPMICWSLFQPIWALKSSTAPDWVTI